MQIGKSESIMSKCHLAGNHKSHNSKSKTQVNSGHNANETTPLRTGHYITITLY